MAKKIKVPIGLRVFLTSIFVFSSVIIAISLVVFFNMRDYVEDTLEEKIGSEMRLLKQEFEAWLFPKFEIVDTLKYVVSELKDKPDQLLQILTEKTYENPDVPWIYYGTTKYSPVRLSEQQGKVLTQNGGYYLDGSGWLPDSGWDWTDRPWFYNAMHSEKITLTDPYKDEDTQKYVVTVSERCEDMQTGAPLGVVAVDLYVDDIIKHIKARKYTPHSQTYLINRVGLFLTHEDETKIKSITYNFFDQDPAFKKYKFEVRSQPELDLILPEYGIYLFTQRIENSEWHIVTYGPLSDFMGPIFTFIRFMVIIALVAILFTLVFSVLASRSISKPIELLKKASLQMAAGNLDYQVKIRSRDEFGELGSFFNEVAVSLKENIERIEKQRQEIQDYSLTLEEKVEERTQELNKVNRELTDRNEQMVKDLQMAERVQKGIIPTAEDFPKNVELIFGSKYLSMENVGGDIYDVIEIGDNTFGFLIADVSGHGVAAALVASMAKVAFRSNSVVGRTPADICRMANRDIYDLIGGSEYYLTAFYGILNIESGRFQFSNAGHHPTVVLRFENDVVEQIDTDVGFIIGIADDSPFENGEIQMKEGDKLLFFTDGLIEARNEQGEFYEYKRLMEFVREHIQSSPVEFVEELVLDLDTFCGEVRQDDDRAILCIEFAALYDPQRSEEQTRKLIARKQAEHSTSEDLEDRPVWDVKHKKAMRLINQGEYQKALELLLEVYERFPEIPKILNSLGVVYYQLGQYEQALQYTKRAVELDITNDKLHSNLVLIQKKLDEPGKVVSGTDTGEKEVPLVEVEETASKG